MLSINAAPRICASETTLQPTNPVKPFEKLTPPQTTGPRLFRATARIPSLYSRPFVVKVNALRLMKNIAPAIFPPSGIGDKRPANPAVLGWVHDIATLAEPENTPPPPPPPPQPPPPTPPP